MGNFTYLRHSQNTAIQTGTTITASTSATAYPSANLKLLPVSKHWRSTGVTSEDLQIAFDAAYAINLLGVINHNLTSAATITVNGGATANPGGGEYTTTITYREFDAFKLLAAAQTWRYWKFIFADAMNPDGYIKVGIPVLGSATTLGFHWRHGSEFADEFVNVFTRSSGGAVYAENIYGIIKHTFRFGPLTVANMATLRTLYRVLKGSASPLFVIPESQTNDGYFGRFTNALTRSLDIYEFADLQFEEDGRGRDIT